MDKIQRSVIIILLLALAAGATVINLKIQQLAADTRVLVQFVVNECQ